MGRKRDFGLGIDWLVGSAFAALGPDMGLIIFFNLMITATAGTAAERPACWRNMGKDSCRSSPSSLAIPASLTGIILAWMVEHCRAVVCAHHNLKPSFHRDGVVGIVRLLITRWLLAWLRQLHNKYGRKRPAALAWSGENVKEIIFYMFSIMFWFLFGSYILSLFRKIILITLFWNMDKLK